MDTKRIAGEKAVEYITDGMTVGLGTGSTVYWTIKKLGELVKAGLSIKAIPTSNHTEILARKLNIPLSNFDEIKELDITIDGADEIDAKYNLIKGGGGALLREKLVAISSKQLVIVADETKVVETLGKFPLPIEVVPFAWQRTAKEITQQLNVLPKLRSVQNEPYITDNGNFILDCNVSDIHAPAVLHQSLKQVTGVIDTGLFPNMANVVIIGSSDGVQVIEKV
ncbi:ribose-5-phosphate isomerase RpiA [Bacillus sp. SCS-151]|uniref:ribose-5-phosphate isomerase RpiA n=1 Tax=Nanhaiella sioensis TaxID=3115293 RepID=UPI00397C3875